MKLMAATTFGPIFSSLFLVSSGISPLEKSTGRAKLFPSDKSASGYKKKINMCQFLRVSIPTINICSDGLNHEFFFSNGNLFPMDFFPVVYD